MAFEVLIVEDNPLNLELARDILEGAGFKVMAARDASECFARLADHLPDLVLMDVQLPDKDGLQITRDLRAEPETRDLLIIAMTAHALIEDESRVMDAGCDGYLTKPILARALVEQVLHFLINRGDRSGSGPEARDGEFVTMRRHVSTDGVVTS